MATLQSSGEISLRLVPLIQRGYHVDEIDHHTCGDGANLLFHCALGHLKDVSGVLLNENNVRALFLSNREYFVRRWM